MYPATPWTRALLAALCFSPTLTALPGQGDTDLVSLSTAGVESNQASVFPSVSADGRFVAFESSASTLVPGDTNFSSDIFVRDRLTGTTTRVSVTSGGGQASSHSYEPSISADGRYVAFTSFANNLVAGDTNGALDVFLHDRATGATSRISVGPGGVQGPSLSYGCDISAGGRYVSFSSQSNNFVAGDSNGTNDVFVRDLLTSTNILASISTAGVQSDGQSRGSAVSDDGQIVVFQSTASNLVPGDTGGHADIFVHDIASGETTRISVSALGVQGNSFSEFADLSDDGRFVTFHSRASTLVPGDTNFVDDIFLYDRQSSELKRISVSSGGEQSISASTYPSITPDGRLIAFASTASNLVPGDTNGKGDIFVHDTQTHITQRVDVGPGGVQSNNFSRSAAISRDGRFVAFESEADNLAVGDTNIWTDIYVNEYLDAALCPAPAVYCTSKPTSLPGCLPAISFSGVPSASAGFGFDVVAGPTPGGNSGLFLYTTGGFASSPISTSFGFLCLGPGMRRIAAQLGGGASGVCNGQYSLDFNLYVATQVVDATLAPGATVDLQAWYRDPANPGGANFTQAGRFLLCP